MSRVKGTCIVCRHPQITEINNALIAGMSMATATRRYSISMGSLGRHMHNCLHMNRGNVAIESKGVAIDNASLPDLKQVQLRSRFDNESFVNEISVNKDNSERGLNASNPACVDRVTARIEAVAEAKAMAKALEKSRGPCSVKATSFPRYSPEAVASFQEHFGDLGVVQPETLEDGVRKGRVRVFSR